MPVKNQPKSILIIIGLVIIFCVLTIFSIVTIVGINDTKTEIKSVQEEIQKNRDKLKQLTQLAENKEQYEKSLEMLTKLIPNQANESQFINLIQNLSKKSSIELIKIEFGDLVVNNNINVMPITLSFNGTYDNFINLIGDMDSCDRLIRIDEVNLTKNETTGSIDAKIVVRTFYR